MKPKKPPHHPKVWAIRFCDGDLSMATWATLADVPLRGESTELAPVEVRLVPEAEYQKMVRAMEGKA